MKVYGIMKKEICLYSPFEDYEEGFVTDSVYDSKEKAFNKCRRLAKHELTEYFDQTNEYDWQPIIVEKTEANAVVVDYDEQQTVYAVVELEVK